jgi:hypothetical protein
MAERRLFRMTSMGSFGRAALAASAAGVLALAGGCASGSKSADAGLDQIEGELTSGIVAIGGETTGWAIFPKHFDEPVDVVVSSVKGKAERYDGDDIVAYGTWEVRNWTERGRTEIFVIQKIEPAS